MSKKLLFEEILIDITDYELIEELGQGGCGAAYKAKNKKTNEEVALKVIFKSIREISQISKQREILREVCIPCQLNSPGIVPLLGFRFPIPEEELKRKPPPKMKIPKGVGKRPVTSEDFNGAIYITKLMKYKSIENYMKQYLNLKGSCKGIKMNPTIRSKIIFGVASTMKRVHNQMIIHRDLKLQNVFLDENLEPRIADFGLARVITPDVQMTMNIGTPIYMAPELFQGDTNYDSSVDVYAFAMFLYFMFMPAPIFEPKIRSPNQMAIKIYNGQRPLNDGSIPAHYWDLIQKCWDHSPLKRPTFADIVNILKDDKYAIKEFDKETDLDDLHEYQMRMEDYEDVPSSFASTISNVSLIETASGEKIKITDSSISFADDHRETDDEERKTEFNWDRH
ncbi:hypothetical protein M9Y10_011551 [Tritrichomonas musculus]|uniref:Protein kinase domain-containing protein n=1 Tax=Tritrichomonas musculus TaxID=1915356 RepID=A0ABR2IJL1_9EUKA